MSAVADRGPSAGSGAGWAHGDRHGSRTGGSSPAASAAAPSAAPIIAVDPGPAPSAEPRVGRRHRAAVQPRRIAIGLTNAGTNDDAPARAWVSRPLIACVATWSNKGAEVPSGACEGGASRCSSPPPPQRVYTLRCSRTRPPVAGRARELSTVSCSSSSPGRRHRAARGLAALTLEPRDAGLRVVTAAC